MVLWFLFSLVTLVAVSLAFPEPVAMVMGPYENPVMFLREKRTPIGAYYPQRAMMFTGYYRPIRRTEGDQATAVFAQGNSVKAGTYLGGGFQPNYLKPGPEPVNEPELPNTEGEPTSQLEGNLRSEDHQNQGHGNRNPIQDQPQNHPDTESYPETTISPEEPTSNTETAVIPPKKNGTKKGKKITRPVKEEEDDDDDDDDNDDEEYGDEDDFTGDTVPFVPMKGKRRYPYPSRNIFFPMMFGRPLGSSRSGSSGSSGSVTAIANSYSTGKGGVANSVATAYGGSPQKKSRRPPTAED